MSERRVGYHRSTKADEPLARRLSIFYNLMHYSADGVDPVTYLSEQCDGRKIQTSLHEVLSSLTIAELRDALRIRNSRSIPRGPKARLVELLYDLSMPRTAEGFLAYVIPYGREGVHQIRKLVESGGRRDVRKLDVERVENLVHSCFPTSLLFDEGTAFVQLVPAEPLELLSSLTPKQWDEYERVADACHSALRFISRAADLRGIVAMDDVLAEWAQGRGEAPDKMVLMALRLPGPWLDDADVAIVNDGNRDYVLAGLLAAIVTNDDGSPDADAIDALCAAHRANDPLPVSEKLLNAESVMELVLQTSEAEDFIELLDNHVPDSLDDDVFSLYVAVSLVEQLRAHDDARCVDDALADVGLRATGGILTRMHQLSEELNRVIPKWHLNGWSLAQIDERAGRRAMPLAPGEGECSEPSGYTPIDKSELPAQGEDRDLWTQLELNDYPDLHFADLLGLSNSPYYNGSGEPDVNAMVAENDSYLDDFEAWLAAKGLRPKTISGHVSNVASYLNSYLAHHEGLPMPYGVGMAKPFLGSFFIRKAMWSTPGTIRSMAASMKKFYNCMHELGHIDRDAYNHLLVEIKEGLSEWCDLCAEYNSPFSESTPPLW